MSKIEKSSALSPPPVASSLEVFPKVALAVDIAVFGVDGQALQLLLIERAAQPFAGQWALPGGFIHQDEPLEAAARRELVEEAGISPSYLEQLYTFGEPRRDPRGRVISVAYFALLRCDEHATLAGSDASAVRWFDCKQLPELAFDHAAIAELALQRLRAKLRYAPIGFDLLPQRFTLARLQTLYEIVLGTELDKRNFRKKVLGLGVLVATNDYESSVRGRAARLYRFDAQAKSGTERDPFGFQI